MFSDERQEVLEICDSGYTRVASGLTFGDGDEISRLCGMSRVQANSMLSLTVKRAACMT